MLAACLLSSWGLLTASRSRHQIFSIHKLLIHFAVTRLARKHERYKWKISSRPRGWYLILPTPHTPIFFVPGVLKYSSLRACQKRRQQGCLRERHLTSRLILSSFETRRRWHCDSKTPGGVVDVTHRASILFTKQPAIPLTRQTSLSSPHHQTQTK